MKTNPQTLVHEPTDYEVPSIEFVGLATDVVLGIPGIGWDGYEGYSEPRFEFAADAE